MSFDPRLPINAQIFIIRIERDEKFIEMLAKEVESFLGEVDKMYQYIKEYRGDMYESTNLS
jgi:hypothetical protein